MTAALRAMAPADLTAVAQLERELFPEDAWSWEMFASEISDRAYGRYYLVAEEAGQVVGYAGLLAQPPVASRLDGVRQPAGQADVLTMAVAASHWGRGIGSALLTALLDEASRRRCTEVFLEVRADNPRAQQLYLRHGFAEAGLRRGYYQPSGVDAIVMRRSVSPVPAASIPAASTPAASTPAASTPAASTAADPAGQATGKDHP